MLNTNLLRQKATIRFSRIVPGKNLQDEKFYFEKTGQLSPAAGWSCINIDGLSKISDPFIQLDLGLGYEDAYKYPLNCLNDELLPSVLLLPDNIKKIRLSFHANDLACENLVIDFISISRAEAFIRIAFYLYRLNRLRGISTTQLLQEKWHQIRKAGVANIFKNLDGFYDYGDTNRPMGYRQWIKKNERYDSELRDAGTVCQFKQAPIKIIVFLELKELGTLKETVASLERQIYQNWRLLLFSDGPLKDEGVDFLNQCMAVDDRVDFYDFSAEGKDDSLTDYFARQKCDYCMWLETGDVLPALALYFFAEAIKQNDNPVLIYCDSDNYDASGERINPHFRPAWNKELFYSQNYISNCCLIQFEVLKKLPFDGSFLQSHFYIYKIILNIIEQEDDDKIFHVPKVLCHKNNLYSKISVQEKSDLERKELIKHFQRLDFEYHVKPGLLPDTHKIVYPFPRNLPRVTLIIPTRDKLKILKKCIHSILALTSYTEYDIIIVDNGSSNHNTLSYFKELKANDNIRVIHYDQPFNFAAINNFAVRQTEAEFVCLLNNDIEIFESRWLEEMIRIALRKEIGCVGAKLLYSNGKVQHAGIICGLGNVAGHAHRYFDRNEPGYFGRLQSVQYYSAITAACMLVRREVYNEMGGMNETLAVAYNDVDFCLRLKKAGYKNVYTPYTELYHHESLSRGAEDTSEKKERYQREVDYMWSNWKHELENDEYYNPNLSRLREDFSL